MARSDAQHISNAESVLFVDLGANLGQGFYWFKKYFFQKNIAFELFEPNPYCIAYLKSLDEIITGEAILHPCGVGITSGTFDFYGTSPTEGGQYSQGGSIMIDHNSKRYQSSLDEAIKVSIIDFSNYLMEKSHAYQKIIVKMDIEGAEVDLLEHLINKNTINLIDILYVEFHSEYLSEEYAKQIKVREETILKKIRNNTKVKLRIWH